MKRVVATIALMKLCLCMACAKGITVSVDRMN